MKSILVVDDDQQMRSALTEAIKRLGYHSALAENGSEALSKLNRASFGMIITDMKMPRMDGLTFLKEVRQKAGHLPVLVITGFGTVENAVETMKEGAYDYLMKPFSFETLKKTINAIMERQNGSREIIAAHPKMKQVLQMADIVARGDTTVLIQGESGTGKELLGKFIHRLSHRKENPFVAVNCAAIPDTLMESELFGYEKGAFTGASEKKMGKFEMANGGTIFLDEISEMSKNLQAKLLRVIQEKEVDRVGGKEPIPLDIRIIATTNRDLYKESLEGRFREDLYYRLNVFPILVPPLRERPDDIRLLVQHFLEKFCAIHGKTIEGLTVEAVDYLLNKQWKGNVRELENVIHRAVLMSEQNRIGVNDFMIDGDTRPPENHSGLIREMEKEMIFKTLKDVNGNKTKAARILGVSVRTIRNKLQEYDGETAL